MRPAGRPFARHFAAHSGHALAHDVVTMPARPAAAELTPRLSLRGVTRTFDGEGGTQLLAIDNVDLQVRAGEFLCLVGPSGCGKSTLLYMMAGLTRPSTGEVWMDSHRVDGPGTDRILIFQDLGLFPWLTVSKNVEFGLKIKGVPKNERVDRAMEYLRLVHLLKFKDSYIHQLSGGMRQRVALARALATDPEVLLMDEPFAALDAQTRDLLHDELERIWSETRRTIIFVTHNVREAVRLGDRVVLLTYRPGRVKREFPVDLPRPRQMEDATLAERAGEILVELRAEINRSLEAEYGSQ